MENNNNNNNNTNTNNNSNENAITINKESLTNKKYVGILLSALSLIVSVILSLIFTPNILTNGYIIFQCILNVALSVGILFSIQPLFGKKINELFQFKNAKVALLSSVGIFILMAYILYLILTKMGRSEAPFSVILKLLIYSLTVGLFNGIIVVFLTTEGYFHLDNKTIYYKYIYALVGSAMYGILTVLLTHGTFETFFQNFALMFALAAVYILSRNIIIVIIINAVFYFEQVVLIVVILSSFSNIFETAFGNYNTIINVLYALMLILAAVLLYIMDKPKETKTQTDEAMV